MDALFFRQFAAGLYYIKDEPVFGRFIGGKPVIAIRIFCDLRFGFTGFGGNERIDSCPHLFNFFCMDFNIRRNPFYTG